MYKKEVVAMLLAGGQGSRLGILTHKVAKPAISFGGKYKIVDFVLSNCINSGIDTVGVLTQYEPLMLNRHIGIGIPWDLDKTIGGVTVLPPYLSRGNERWYSGTANAIYHNIDFIEYYHPEYVLILSGDHIYKMDYEIMLRHHKNKQADVSIGVFSVPYEEASRYGIMNTNEAGEIIEFEEKPTQPKSNLASMGIYIFNWKVLKQALLNANRSYNDSDFGKHIIPYCLKNNYKLVANVFDGYWKDVGTLQSYWEANMELISLVPEFNLYEEYWKIYTKNESQTPEYFGEKSVVDRAIVGEGTEIYGEVYNCVIGSNVFIGQDTKVYDSIIMSDTVINNECVIMKAILSENVTIGNNVIIGKGDDTINQEYPDIYHCGITVVGNATIIPNNVLIGRNCALKGKLHPEDFEHNELDSGKNIVREEEVI